MSGHTLTGTPPGGRGCGKRKEGGVYLSLGVSSQGIPIWDILFDPVVPHVGAAWQGIKVDRAASDAWTDALGQPTIVLLDMVSKEDYPGVPAFVEETRRFGLSRRIPDTFPFDMLAGHAVFLVTTHWRAMLRWQQWAHFNLPPLPDVHYWPCKHLHTSDDLSEPLSHYANCTYHLWPHDVCLHWMSEWEEKVDWRYSPMGVVGSAPTKDVLELVEMFPLPKWSPGRFAAWPITHLEAVSYVPERAVELMCDGALGGLPVEITEA